MGPYQSIFVELYYFGTLSLSNFSYFGTLPLSKLSVFWVNHPGGYYLDRPLYGTFYEFSRGLWASLVVLSSELSISNWAGWVK